TLIGPSSSSGQVNLLRRMENFLPFIQFISESSSKLFAQPGGPTSRTFSRATRPVRVRSISCSLSISASAISRRTAANLACSGQASLSSRTIFIQGLLGCGGCSHGPVAGGGTGLLAVVEGALDLGEGQAVA